MSAAPRAILFDFDGVIVHSEPIHFIAFDRVLRDIDVELDEQKYYVTAIGCDDRGALKRLLAAVGREVSAAQLEELLLKKHAAMRSLLTGGTIDPLPGVRALLSRIHGQIPLAICSGATRHDIELMLHGIGLRHCFEIITSAEDVRVPKPDPEGYLLTTQRLSEKIGQPLSPADCLVVEDAPSVIETTRKAGFRTLGVTTSFDKSVMRVAEHVVETLDPSEIHRAMPEWNILES